MAPEIEPRVRHRLRGAVVWLGVAIWVLAPLGGLVLLDGLDGRASFAAPVPVSAPVEAHDQPVARTVDLGLRWVDGVTAPAPDWSGTVQEVHTGPGEQVASGSPVATIDGVTRLAWASTGAFARPLGAGDRGPDAEWLNGLLAELGHPHATGDRVTARTVRGVGGLARDLGIRGEVTVFDPTWLVYLPVSPMVVAEVGLTAGHPAPPAGEPVLTATADLERAVLAERGTYAGSSLDTTGMDLSASLRALPGEQLLVAGTPFPLDADGGAVAPEALSELAGKLAADSTGVTAQLVRDPGDEEYVVPSAALVTGASGETCVTVAAPVANTGRTVPVHVVASTDGRTVITGDVRPGDHVLVSGRRDAPACP